MLEDIKKFPRKERIPEKTPDLIMQINATEKQLADFRIEIQGSKIICKGKSGKVKGDTGTFLIPDTIFDFSTENNLLTNQPLLRNQAGEVHLGDVKLTLGLSRETHYSLRSFPNASHVSLKYFTPQARPRTDVPGEYRAWDYFELKITNKDNSKKTFYLERNLEIFER
jgi:hypothetical protein